MQDGEPAHARSRTRRSASRPRGDHTERQAILVAAAAWATLRRRGDDQESARSALASPPLRRSSLLVAGHAAGLDGATRQDVTIAVDGRRRSSRRRSLLPRRGAAGRRLARGRLPARPRRRPRRARSRSPSRWGSRDRYAVLAYDARGHGAVRRPDRDRRAARDRRRAGRVRLAARSARRRRHADRRLGHLLRRRRARGTRSRPGRRGPRSRWPITWTDLRSALDAAGPRQVGRRRRVPRLAPARAGRPRGARDPRRRVRAATSRRSSPVGGRALVARRARGREDAGLHDAGPSRLRLRARPGDPRLVARSPARSGSGSGCTAMRRRRSPQRTRPRCSPRRRAWFDQHLRRRRAKLARPRGRWRSPPRAGRAQPSGSRTLPKVGSTTIGLPGTRTIAPAAARCSARRGRSQGRSRSSARRS